MNSALARRSAPLGYSMTEPEIGNSPSYSCAVLEPRTADGGRLARVYTSTVYRRMPTWPSRGRTLSRQRAWEAAVSLPSPKTKRARKWRSGFLGGSLRARHHGDGAPASWCTTVTREMQKRIAETTARRLAPIIPGPILTPRYLTGEFFQSPIYACSIY